MKHTPHIMTVLLLIQMVPWHNFCPLIIFNIITFVTPLLLVGVPLVNFTKRLPAFEEWDVECAEEINRKILYASVLCLLSGIGLFIKLNSILLMVMHWPFGHGMAAVGISIVAVAAILLLCLSISVCRNEAGKVIPWKMDIVWALLSLFYCALNLYVIFPELLPCQG
jgi:hypothetical protein